MVQKYFVLVGALVFLAGCASTQQGQSVADMQLRISDLERQVEAKDEEIKELKYSVKDMSYEMDRIKTQSQRGSSARTSDSKSASYVKNDENNWNKVRLAP
jgi:cell division protein FtsL